MNKVLPYHKLACIYDRLMDHVDYKRWSEYIMNIIRNSGRDYDSLIDLSCGTGSFINHMQGSIDVLFGCDKSGEMITHAKKKRRLATIPLFINDICNIAVSDNSFDCAVFLYDSLNYITGKSSLDKSLNEINRILKKRGIFIFDVITENHCKEYYKDFYESEYWDNEGYSRHSYYDQKYGYQYSEFRIVLEGRTFKEKHRQRVYTIEFLNDILDKNLFEVKDMFDDFSFEKANDYSGRIHFVCVKL
jgi:ubiquinone/menaquinone biosynthesis C-methylase UbiE